MRTYARRDFQRSKVYAAERKISEGKRFESLDEIRAYLKRVTTYAWFKRRWPRWAGYDWYLKDGRGTRIARGGGGMLSLPLWARTERTILHELCHSLDMGRRAHGIDFCKAMLEVTRYARGKDVADELRAAYKAHGVRYRGSDAKRNRLREQRKIRHSGEPCPTCGRSGKQEVPLQLAASKE